MKIEVAFTPAGLGSQDTAGRTVFVIDVLRATTTICAALHHGARAVVPCESPDEAVRLAQSLGPDVLLAGERQALPIPGFHLGNSPREMTREAVAGRLVALATTNGTRALLSAAGGADVVAACAGNLSLAAERLRRAVGQGMDVLVICAGREGRFGIDDAYVAGRLLSAVVDDIPGAGLSDAARASLELAAAMGTDWAAALRQSRAAGDLVQAGLADDIDSAARPDALPVLPQLRDRRLTLAGD